VAHVQRAGDVRRRNDDAEHRRVRISIYLGRKIPISLPPFVVVLFGFLRVVLFGDLHANSCFVLGLKRKARVYARPWEKFKTADHALEKFTFLKQTAIMTN